MKVPFLDLKSQHETIRHEIAAAMEEVIDNTSFAGGSQVKRFEDNFARYCRCDHAIGVGSGTDALWMTLLGLEKVYMEVFLPAREAGLLPIGAEARIVLDALPDYAIPATVSFVSPEAQFTPKQVETMSEREQLVFRVRVRIPQDLIQGRIEHVKTGLRGVAIIRLDSGKVWPEALERRIPAELFE